MGGGCDLELRPVEAQATLGLRKSVRDSRTLSSSECVRI